MFNKLLAIPLFVISLASLTIFAVVPALASEFAISSTVTPNRGPNQISIDESADGTTIGLLVGDSLKVSLRYTGGAPVIWQIDQYNTSVLQLVNNYDIPPSAPGGPGTEVWVFNAIGVGTSPLLMEYRGLGGTVVRTYGVTVNVEAATLPVPASSNLTIGILVACLTAFLAWLTLKKPRQAQI